MHIHCDQDLIQQCDSEHFSQKISGPGQVSILASWHASIIKIMGNDFLIFVHSKSLYSTLDFLDFSTDPNLTQSLSNLRGKISEILSEECFLSDGQIKSLVRPFQSVTFGQIKDPRMNRIIQGIGIAYHKRFLQARHTSSQGEVRLWELEEDLNNTSRRNLGGSTPLSTFQELIRSGLN